MAEEEEGPPTSSVDLTIEELELRVENKEVLEQILRLAETLGSRRAAYNQTLAAGNRQLQRSLDIQRDEIAITEQRLAAATNLNTKIELGNTLRNQEIRLLEAATREAAQTAAAAGEGATEERKKVRELQQGLDAYRQQTSAQKNLSSGGRLLLKTLTGISKSHQQSLVYSGIMAKSWTDMQGTVMNIARSWKEVGTDILGSTLQKVQEVTFATIKTVSSLNAQFAQQTGFIAANSTQLEGNWRSLKRQFAGLEDVQAARTALMSQSSRFIHMGQSEQNQMVQLAATLKQVGVDMGDFTKTVNFLQVGLGMSVNQIEAFENRLHELGQQVGFSTMQMQREWVQAQGTLAKYGQRSEEVFRGLTHASKETGIATSQLIGITDQFVTFEGAANIVGKFNALLGGPYLNTIQMVYAQDHERLALLRQVFKQARLNWGQMSEHEQMSYAMAAGIKDMAVATQLFGTTDAAFRRHNAEQRKLADLAKASKDIFDRFKVSMMQLAVALEPLLQGLGRLADWLSGVLPDSTEGMTRLVGGLGIAYVTLTSAIRVQIGTMITANGVRAALKGTTLAAAGAEATRTATTEASIIADNASIISVQRRTVAMGALRGAVVGVVSAIAAYNIGKAVAEKKGARTGKMVGIGSGIAMGAAAGAMFGGVPGAVVGGAIGGIGAAIPSYQGGTGRRGHPGGPMIVGDRRDRNMRGAEIVAPRGTNVISAQQTGEILAAAQINKEAMGVLVSAIGRLTSRMDVLGRSIGSIRGGRGTGGGGEVEKTVILNVDGTTLGSVVVDVLRDRHEIGLVAT